MAYKFPETINDKNFFKFSKQLVLSGKWATLPLSTNSIFPVIASFANSEGIAYPTQETIGILSGCGLKTVREGIAGLLKMSDIKIHNKISKRGLRQKIYTVQKPSDSVESFSFYKSVVEDGQWRVLRIDEKSRAAHAVYCTLLVFSFFDINWYNEIEGEFYDGNDLHDFYENIFPERTYDFVKADIGVVAEYSGVERKAAIRAYHALIGVELLKELPSAIHGENKQVWQIFRIPPVSYKRSYLNENLPKPHIENEFVKNIINKKHDITTHRRDITTKKQDITTYEVSFKVSFKYLSKYEVRVKKKPLTDTHFFSIFFQELVLKMKGWNSGESENKIYLN
ncbi:MAG: hypothetical protein PF482_15285 [Desulfobacteraceae bacterium]|nr:hypothetical protein [Desulfobacteraceae bacterium]